MRYPNVETNNSVLIKGVKKISIEMRRIENFYPFQSLSTLAARNIGLVNIFLVFCLKEFYLNKKQ